MNGSVLAARKAATETDLRSSGIDGVGALPWGAHFCQLYASREDLLEILVPYFEHGLRSNEFCIWITSDALGPEAAAAALRARFPGLDQCLADGQIEIRDYRDWYTSSGRFDGERVRRRWLEKLDAALDRGFEGLRLSGDTFWVGGDEWEPFIHYEADLDPLIAERRMLAICTYALEKCGVREIFDAVANHDFALIRERGRWTPFKSFARRRTERVSRESEARLRATIDGASDGIVTFDHRGAILLANAAAVRMFGYTQEELIGGSVGALAPELDELASGGAPPDYGRFVGVDRDGEGRRKDGSSFPMSWSLREVLLDRQNLFVGFIRDLTRQRAAEARIQELHLDRVSAMGGMATALAHELNQPLTATATYLQAAQRLLQMPSELRPATLEGTLASATAQALRAGKILRHIREFVARGEPDKAVWRLHELIAAACELTRESAKQANVDVILDLRAENDSVIADRIQIEQVIVNLNRNAIEAMHGRARRRLIISTVCAKDMIQVDIVDTGAGLPEDFMARLFEPFTTSKANSMGVGLSISRSIVEAHYGEMWARSNPDGGAIMSFTLPRANEEV